MVLQNVLEQAQSYLDARLQMCTRMLGEGDSLVFLTKARLDRIQALRGQRERRTSHPAPPVKAVHQKLPQSTNTATFESVLATAECLILKEKWLEAIQLLKPLAVCFELDNTTDFITPLAILEVMANCHAVLGQWSEFNEYNTIVLSTRSRLLGPKHSDTLRSLTTLCSVFEVLGEYTQAVLLASQLLDHYRRKYGELHLSTTNKTLHLATLQLLCGKVNECKELSQRALNSTTSILDESHPT